MTNTALEVRGLQVFHGDLQALFGVSLRAAPGEVVALLGANGAGKSSLLGGAAGMFSVSGGEVLVNGENVAGLPPFDIVKRGVALAPEGRRLFPSLSVRENLDAGGYAGRRGRWNPDTVIELFPALAELMDRPSTALSGGQQQMVAIGRALCANPDVLLCDELSLGLSPAVAADLCRALPSIAAEGAAIVVVEQDITRALSFAGRFYCLCEGEVSYEGAVAECDREKLTAAYFGVS